MAEKTPTIENPDEGPETEGPVETSRPGAADPLTDLRRENEELRTKLLYLQAEFENFRKRTARDAETFVRYAHEVLLSELLPVLDEFDVAVAHVAGKSGEGLRMVRDRFAKVLQAAGLQEIIPAKELPFDPYTMEAVQRVPDKGSREGVVKDVVRKGYRYHDRVLRPAQVIVISNGSDTHG